MAKFGVAVSVIEPGNYASQIGNTAKKRIEDTNYWPEGGLYEKERQATLVGLSNVLEGADPLPVAQAALHFMQSAQPKRRYMVVASERQAQATLRSNIRRLLEQNQSQDFSYSTDELNDIFAQEVEKLSAEVTE